MVKKIILLAPLPPPYGGIAVWTSRMMKAKLPSDWSLCIVDEKVTGNRTVFGKNTKRSFSSEIKRCFKIWLNLGKYLQDKDTKIVHICIPAGIGSLAREIISALLSKFFRRKVIVHFRCTLPYMVKGPINLLMFKFLTLFSDELFVLNQASADFLKKIRYNRKYAIIPNFINESELNKNRICSKKIKNILYVGGVIPEKGCDRIINVAKLMPEFQFRLVGKVGINAENLPPNVVLLGEQNKDFVHDELVKADVFLFVSEFLGEGFSNALAEAMAAGLPCIVSNWAANADMIEDKGGIVLKENTVECIIDALKKMDNCEYRQKNSIFNYNKACSEYIDNVIINQYIYNYENLLLKE